jgi:hypothetical protein
MKHEDNSFSPVDVLMMLLSGVVSAQQKPTTGYAPVNGLKMYYEIHGSGEPVVLLPRGVHDDHQQLDGSMG